ncbi:MAG: heme NO-binding domain-containing protein [Neomegalonema sp.]|nr:heme NO-binding domain-containing protein [Neomegalonema sp.]
MKGVVFTEFIDFVEQSHGDDVVDQMIDNANPPSGGAYTAVGRYDFAELAALIGALSTIINRPAPQLIRAFGGHLFHRLAALHPHFIRDAEDPLDFIESVENVIHVEVKKLYPDAELPTLTPHRLSHDRLELDYCSCRPLGELCVGLIEGCAAHFDATLAVECNATSDGLMILISRQVAKGAADDDAFAAPA